MNKVRLTQDVVFQAKGLISGQIRGFRCVLFEKGSVFIKTEKEGVFKNQENLKFEYLIEKEYYEDYIYDKIGELIKLC